MIPMLLAAAASQVAAPAARWTIDGQPGAVRSVTAAVKTGGRIVADGFVADAAAARAEKSELATTKAPAGSCAWAAAVRPFTRLRRFARDGRLLWQWRVSGEQQALRLLSGWPGDCLSPDGGRLLVVSYRLAPGEPVSELGGAIVAVDRRPRFVEATGRRTGEVFGRLQALSDYGWRRRGDATLAFTIYDEGTGRETPDEAVLGRRR